ncbi:MAG TPA: hypothetical protein VMU49_09210 [Candidatus Acidoferrales bacterium]|nr:hypothetical protein [Candidatus Acidoferrales bacterium]
MTQARKVGRQRLSGTFPIDDYRKALVKAGFLNPGFQVDAAQSVIRRHRLPKSVPLPFGGRHDNSGYGAG